MRYKNILMTIAVLVPLGIILRVMTVSKAVEASTGFFITEQKTLGIVLTLVIFACAGLIAVLSSFAYNKPDKAPKPSIFVSVASLAVAFFILQESFNLGIAVSITAAHIFIMRIAGIIAAAFFSFYALFTALDLAVPSFSFVIPVIYFIIKVTIDFLEVSPIALISDNVLRIGSECFVLVFMLYFAKLSTKTDEDKDFRKLMATGFSATLICITTAVGQLLSAGFLNGGYGRFSFEGTLMILSLGLFALAFTLSYFSENTEN